MAEVITRFKLETTQFNSKLRDASKELSSMVKEAQKTGKGFGEMSSKALESARSLGTVSSGATTTRDKVRDLVGAYNDAAKAFNSLTEEQKKGEFGRALSTSLTQLSSRIREAKDELYGLGDAMEKKNVGGLFSSDKISGMLQVFGGNLMTKAAGMAASFVGELGEAVKQGAELARQGEGIRHAFERLGRGDLLQGLREATHGTVTDIELMKAAVKFSDFKLPVEELGTMLAFAQQKAKDTGQSVDYMVDSIVTGLGRKSLLILDNLGLSASEIKDRMKDTGDMTKAVGEIIREQMSKAGDYVETAADRATKANVDLQNAMENLGRTFQPLTDAGVGMWNSLKIAAIDLLNNAVKPLIEALSEAGALGKGAQANAGFKGHGGEEKLNRMINRLGDGKSAKAYEIYKKQLEEFDKYINGKKFQIAAYGNDNSSIAQSAKQKLQTELDGALKMREEYVKRAKKLHDSVPAVAEEVNKNASTTKNTSTVKGVSSIGSGVVTVQTELQQNQAKINTLTEEYVLLSDQSTDSARQRLEAIRTEIAALERRNDTLKLYGEQAQGKLLGGNVQTSGIGNGGTQVQGLGSFAELPTIGEGLDPKVLEQINKQMREMYANTKDIIKSANITADVVGSIGQAFSAIDDPAAKVAGTVMQAVASVALGYAKALTHAEEVGGPWGWVAFAATGLATMLTTISAIHSATGYANGGRVEGNSYSGDNIPIMANAGEIVLNQAQQSNVAAGLQGAAGAMGNMRLRSEVRGSNLVLVIDRALKEQGSELAVWGR